MNKLRKKNLDLLKKSGVYHESMEHDACGVGLIASTNGKKSRKIVEYGIEALKAIWHRGAVDADGKSGDGAGIQIEIAPDFFKEKILSTGHTLDENKRICVEGRDIASKILSKNPKYDLAFYFKCNLNTASYRRWKEEEDRKKQLEYIRIKEWEERFDKEQKEKIKNRNY